MSLITPSFGLIFWMTLIFAILFFLLAKFGFPVITKSVRERNERITESLRQAQEAEQRLSGIAQEQDRLIKEAQSQQSRILKEAAQARDEIIAQAQTQAHNEASKIIENARLQIAAEKESALRDIRREVAVLSVSIAEKILRRDLSQDKAQIDLLEKMVEEVKSSQKTS